MEDQADGKRLHDANDDIGNEADRCFYSGQSLNLLEAESSISDE